MTGLEERKKFNDAFFLGALEHVSGIGATHVFWSGQESGSRT